MVAVGDGEKEIMSSAATTTKSETTQQPATQCLVSSNPARAPTTDTDTARDNGQGKNERESIQQMEKAESAAVNEVTLLDQSMPVLAINLVEGRILISTSTASPVQNEIPAATQTVSASSTITAPPRSLNVSAAGDGDKAVVLSVTNIDEIRRSTKTASDCKPTLSTLWKKGSDRGSITSFDSEPQQGGPNLAVVEVASPANRTSFIVLATSLDQNNNSNSAPDRYRATSTPGHKPPTTVEGGDGDLLSEPSGPLNGINNNNNHRAEEVVVEKLRDCVQGIPSAPQINNGNHVRNNNTTIEPRSVINGLPKREIQSIVVQQLQEANSNGACDKESISSAVATGQKRPVEEELLPSVIESEIAEESDQFAQLERRIVEGGSGQEKKNSALIVSVDQTEEIVSEDDRKGTMRPKQKSKSKKKNTNSRKIDNKKCEEVPVEMDPITDSLSNTPEEEVILSSASDATGPAVNVEEGVSKEKEGASASDTDSDPQVGGVEGHIIDSGDVDLTEVEQSALSVAVVISGCGGDDNGGVAQNSVAVPEEKSTATAAADEEMEPLQPELTLTGEEKEKEGK